MSSISILKCAQRKLIYCHAQSRSWNRLFQPPDMHIAVIRVAPVSNRRQLVPSQNDYRGSTPFWIAATLYCFLFGRCASLIQLRGCQSIPMQLLVSNTGSCSLFIPLLSFNGFVPAAMDLQLELELILWMIMSQYSCRAIRSNYFISVYVMECYKTLTDMSTVETIESGHQFLNWIPVDFAAGCSLTELSLYITAQSQLWP